VAARRVAVLALEVDAPLVAEPFFEPARALETGRAVLTILVHHAARNVDERLRPVLAVEQFDARALLGVDGLEMVDSLRLAFGVLREGERPGKLRREV
jgi:hypothetical protein